MLGILVGLSQIFRPRNLNPLGWSTALGVVSVFYLAIAERAWGASMLLFAFYFPQRWRLDEKLPWLKWLLIGPLAVLAVWDGILRAMYAVNYTAALRIAVQPPQWIRAHADGSFDQRVLLDSGREGARSESPARPRRRKAREVAALGYPGGSDSICIDVFFEPDLPTSIAAQDGPLLVLALMAMVLLPVTMAYVIVVERALDVRVVVRQGMQYALARGGIRVIQFCLGVIVVYMSVALLESRRVGPIAGYSSIGAGVSLVIRIRDLGDRVRGWLDRRFFREAYDAERILGELSEQVRAILDTRELLETVMRKIGESLHVERIAVLLPDRGGCSGLL